MTKQKANESPSLPRVKSEQTTSLTGVDNLSGGQQGSGEVLTIKDLHQLLRDVTRLTIIDHTEANRFGSFERWKIKLTPMIQDNKRTLKLVVEDDPKAAGPGRGWFS